MIKNLGGIVFLAMAMGLLSACARFHRGDPVTVRAGEERPPDFLIGPMSVLLTNVDGFSAQLVENTAVGGTIRQDIMGELICREGRLIFQPTHKDRRLPKDADTGLFFIWDGNQDRGYVLSEELQGYAPIVSNLKITQLSVEPDSAVESIQGHPCRKVEVAVTLANGSKARFAEWRADDLKQFPLRVRSLDSPNTVTLDFSKVRLEYASPRLFNPPDGFIQYANAVALMNELMIRQSTLKQRPGQLEEQMPVTGSQNWGPTVPGQVGR